MQTIHYIFSFLYINIPYSNKQSVTCLNSGNSVLPFMILIFLIYFYYFKVVYFGGVNLIEVRISKELKELCPNLVLGCIQATVTLKEDDTVLSKEIINLCKQINDNIALEQIANIPEIIDARETYKKLGKSPSRYRVSSEALLRRVVQGKGLYQINNIVDINNFISLKSKYSLGTYDIGKVQPPIVFTIGTEGQTYKGIGKDLINIANLPVFTDCLGSFGSPTSDSERAMITMDTKKILMNIISFSGVKNVAEYLNSAKQLLEMYAEAKEIETKIVE